MSDRLPREAMVKEAKDLLPGEGGWVITLRPTSYRPARPIWVMMDGRVFVCDNSPVYPHLPVLNHAEHECFYVRCAEPGTLHMRIDPARGQMLMPEQDKEPHDGLRVTKFLTEDE